jgi:hypothetical protein
LLHSAKWGFPSAKKIADLQDLIKKLEVPVDKLPTAEIECLKVLLRYVVPDIDDVTEALYSSRRHKKHKGALVFGSVLADMSVTDIADDVIDHDLKMDLVAAAKDYHKHVEAMELAAVPKAKPAGPAPKKKRKFAQKDLLVLDAATKLLPEVDGCSITIETLWHLRFKVNYPTWEPPFGTSMCFNDEDPTSKRIAMLFCLTWAWTHHERQEGVVCPYDLSV